MKKLVVFCSVLMFTLHSFVFSQDDSILPAQADAIRTLAFSKGFTIQTLQAYVLEKWGMPLEKFSRTNASLLITRFQSSNPPLPSEIATPVDNTPPIIAEILEVGMAKQFHLVDGNIIQGVIVKIDSGLCHIECADGVLEIPMKDILEETAEVTKRDGSRYVGPVLKESVEELTLRSKYGNVVIAKREIQDMNRYHGGKLVSWAEEKKTFYRSDVILTDIFFDPTAFPLETNSLYISALSLGYGFTDNFMVRTSFGNNFSGDLNLQPLFQFYSKRTATNRIALAVGLDMYSHHNMTSVIAKYAKYVQRKSDKISIFDQKKEILSLPAGYFSLTDVIEDSYKSTFYSEIYIVLSQRWTLESSRGEMGYHIGVRTNTLPFIRSSMLAKDFEWSDDVVGKIPFRFWVAFEYDLTKNLKLASNVWADNGYRFRTPNQVLKDYFTETPFVLDGVGGQYRAVDFDFGILYAVNNSLRIGIHFNDPYLVLFWRILEF